jgi:hypothetical protein
MYVYIADFRSHKVYENGLKSVKNKCNNMCENVYSIDIVNKARLLLNHI